jgi:hypothetical protein
MKVQYCPKMEELIEKSDALLIAAPEYLKKHAELAELPIRCGKPLFLDKIVTTEYASTKKLLSLADKYNTPVYACSVLRFFDELIKTNRDDIKDLAYWFNANELEIIHLIDPVIMLMKSSPKRIQYIKGNDYVHYFLEFKDKRCVTMSGYGVLFKDTPLLLNIFHEKNHEILKIELGEFDNFYTELVDFYKTGKPKLSHEEMLDIVSVYEAAVKSRQSPGEWIAVRKS